LLNLPNRIKQHLIINKKILEWRLYIAV